MANEPHDPTAGENSLIAALAHAPDRSIEGLSPHDTRTMPDGQRPRALEPGDRAGRFEVTGKLGAGGMGEVYAAYDSQLHRRVALKVMRGRRHGAAEGAGLQREAQAMARLQHAHVVTVYDVGRLEGGEEFVAMELVDGSSLRQWLAAQERNPREILKVFLGAGRGLAAAHEAGIVHRDFKPDNVLVGKDGSVRVADFGLAVPVAPEGDPTRASLLSFAGTPRYMADEQRRGLPADARSDQYSFCVALYEALAGRHPFEVRDAQGRATLDRPAPAPPPRTAGLSSAVWPAILRGLSKDPGKRHASMPALLRELEHDPWQARTRWGAVALAAVAIASVALGGRAWARHRRDLCTGGERRLVGVWGDPKRAAVEQALSKARPAAGPQAFEPTLRALDAYAQTLVAAHGEACEAAQVRGEQSATVMDLRMRCLDRISAELSAQVAVLEGADATVANKAADSVRQLRPASVCADVPALSAPDPRPQDEARRARIAAVEKRTAEALALLRSTKAREARALLEELVPEAKSIAWAPLNAELWLLLGRAREGAGDARAAEAAFEECLVEAAAGRHDDVAAQAWTLLAINLGRVQQRFKEARLVARLAHAAMRRLGGVERERNLEQAEGLLAFADGQFADAKQHYLRALALDERHRGPGSPMAADLLNSLGITARAQGEPDEARPLLLRALSLYEKEQGPDGPLVAMVQGNLSGVELSLGNVAEAERLARRSLELGIAQLGPTHRAQASRYFMLSNALRAQGRWKEALEAVDRASAVTEAANGPDHKDTLGAHEVRAEVLASLGREREAKALLLETLAAQERVLGKGNHFLARTYNALGEMALRERDAATAARHFSRALELSSLAKYEGVDVALDEAGLAAAEALAGHVAKADPLLKAARARVAEKKGGPDVKAFVLYAEAEAKRASGDRAGARAALDEAARLVQVSGGSLGALIEATRKSL